MSERSIKREVATQCEVLRGKLKAWAKTAPLRKESIEVDLQRRKEAAALGEGNWDMAYVHASNRRAAERNHKERTGERVAYDGPTHPGGDLCGGPG